MKTEEIRPFIGPLETQLYAALNEFTIEPFLEDDTNIHLLSMLIGSLREMGKLPALKEFNMYDLLREAKAVRGKGNA